VRRERRIVRERGRGEQCACRDRDEARQKFFSVVLVVRGSDT